MRPILTHLALHIRDLDTSIAFTASIVVCRSCTSA